MFTGKIKTLRGGLAIIKWGHGFKSKKILFLTDLLNHISHAKKELRNKIAKWLAKASINNELFAKLKIKAHDPIMVKFRLNDYSDYQSLAECLGNMYEIPDIKIDHLIDAGANIGFFSISMFNKLPINDAIIIEPNPKNLDLLKYNLSGFPHCKILPFAISGLEGNVVFELATSNTGHIKGSAGHETTASNVMVPSKKLSKLIPANWEMKHTLLKLDVEGAEYEIIPEMFANHFFPKLIVGEIHDYLHSGGAELVQQLSTAGYSVSVTGNGVIGNVCRQFLAIKK